MATNASPQTEITTQDVDPTMHPSTPAAQQPPPSAPSQVPAPEVPAAPPAGTPQGLVDRGDPDMPNESAEQKGGVGIEGETPVWESRYAMKNFLGRLIGMGILSMAWLALAIYTWGGFRSADAGNGAKVLAVVTGVALAIMWLVLIRRMILARYGHYYRLTNRRLFVSTGLFLRRRDQMELLKVEDVYTRQTFTGRMLSLGTVVVVSKDPHYPVMYLTGVEDPKGVMDLVWHHARAERDRRSVKVDQI